jgi:hypothetical protein
MNAAFIPALVFWAIALAAGLTQALVILRRDGLGARLWSSLIPIGVVCSFMAYSFARSSGDIVVPAFLAGLLVLSLVKDLGILSDGFQFFERFVYVAIFGRRLANRIQRNANHLKNSL